MSQRPRLDVYELDITVSATRCDWAFCVVQMS